MAKKTAPKKKATESKAGAAKKSTGSEAKYVTKEAPGRGKVEILAETYEPDTPVGEGLGKWRQKLESREDKLKYLQTGERYWYSDDWFGSEKRKNPA
jgi:hypothetical protein